VTVEFAITIDPTLDSITIVSEELEPEPMPEPPVDDAELFAVTNEFKISKPATVEDPLSDEPLPIPEPTSTDDDERVLASTRDSRIRIKPVIEAPFETDPVPIPEPPDPRRELLLAVTVE
jgi:hypothetical protein